MPNRTSYAEAMGVQILRGISSSHPNHANQQAPPSQLRISPDEWRVPGEEVKLEDSNVSLVYAKDAKIPGRVYVTNYRLRFEPDDQAYADKILDVTLGSISKVSKYGRSSVKVTDERYGLLITCKDARGLFFEHRRKNHSRRALYESLQLHAFPHTNQLPFFATVYSQGSPQNRHLSSINGWALFDTEREFQRQRLPVRLWSITRINANYAFCPTYPNILAVPTAVVSKVEGGDKFLRAVAKSRSRCRIPVLSWIDRRTGAAIVRSAQPMYGIPPKKSEKDEQYLKMLIAANENSKNLVILDARPAMNARANAVKGGGWENYPDCELEFLDIQNIHVVRKSLNALKSECYPIIKMSSFNGRLTQTKWLDHLKTILNGSIRVVAEISIRRNSVLVHCSDGWDRTAQLTSLAMLQLDPYYRTIEGFAVLIEKEWISFGHKFAQRIGHGEDKHGDEERAPIFVQFIDCVWQLYNQFTSSFEFNSLLLRTILDELYACRFGTFLYNAEKERRDMEVKKNTVSLWTHVLENRDKFLNMAFEPPIAGHDPLNYCLNTVTQRPHVHFWSEYYCQHNMTVIPSGSELLPRTPSASCPSTSLDGSVNLPITSGSGSCYELYTDEEKQRFPSWDTTVPTRSGSMLLSEQLKRRPADIPQPPYSYFAATPPPPSYLRRPSEPTATYNTRL